MKNVAFFFSVLFLNTMACSFLHAQGVTLKTIQWNASSTLDIQEGNWVDEQTMFVSSANTLEWKNADGVIRHSFEILSRTGEWQNPGQNGMVRFEVKAGEARGTVTIRKVNKDFMIIILVNSQPDPIMHELTIESFSEIKGKG